VEPGHECGSGLSGCGGVPACLRSVGATTANLTGAVLYIVDLDPAKLKQVSEGIRRASERLGVSFQHPGTYIGVTSLFDPNYLIEIVGTAVID
jgi:enamine deaminase RidA (YjgF/YER057c/UK114 family)